MLALRSTRGPIILLWPLLPVVEAAKDRLMKTLGGFLDRVRTLYDLPPRSASSPKTASEGS